MVAALCSGFLISRAIVTSHQTTDGLVSNWSTSDNSSPSVLISQNHPSYCDSKLGDQISNIQHESFSFFLLNKRCLLNGPIVVAKRFIIWCLHKDCFNSFIETRNSNLSKSANAILLCSALQGRSSWYVLMTLSIECCRWLQGSAILSLCSNAAPQVGRNRPQHLGLPIIM